MGYRQAHTARQPSLGLTQKVFQPVVASEPSSQMGLIKQTALPQSLLQHGTNLARFGWRLRQERPHQPENRLGRSLISRPPQKSAQPAAGIADPRIPRPAKTCHQKRRVWFVSNKEKVQPFAGPDPPGQ